MPTLKKSQDITTISWDENSFPRYHPTCTHDPIESSHFLSGSLHRIKRPLFDLTRLLRTNLLVIFYLFRRSAPECSRHLLFQTTLSVGDAVFLLTPENGSLLLRIYLFAILSHFIRECKNFSHFPLLGRNYI